MPHVLVVCTANRCRSPMGEVLLRAELERRNVLWEVSSAGLMHGGSPVVEEVDDVMAQKFDIDMTQHRSRRLSPLLIDEVDLVLGMERRHVREVAMTEPRAFGRAFTVKEFVRRTTSAPPSGQALQSYLQLLSSGRSAKMMLGHEPTDEIADPIGKSPAVFEASADEIAASMGAVAKVLADLH